MNRNFNVLFWKSFMSLIVNFCALFTVHYAMEAYEWRPDDSPYYSAVVFNSAVFFLLVTSKEVCKWTRNLSFLAPIFEYFVSVIVYGLALLLIWFPFENEFTKVPQMLAALINYGANDFPTSIYYSLKQLAQFLNSSNAKAIFSFLASFFINFIAMKCIDCYKVCKMPCTRRNCRQSFKCRLHCHYC